MAERSVEASRTRRADRARRKEIDGRGLAWACGTRSQQEIEAGGPGLFHFGASGLFQYTCGGLFTSVFRKNLLSLIIPFDLATAESRDLAIGVLKKRGTGVRDFRRVFRETTIIAASDQQDIWRGLEAGVLASRQTGL